jgi:hypothetical protein
LHARYTLLRLAARCGVPRANKVMDAPRYADAPGYAEDGQEVEQDPAGYAEDTHDSRPPLPWVVPKNPPKWDERLIDFAVAEHAHTLPVSVDTATAARDTMVAVKGVLWEAFRARGKPSKPRTKKGAEGSPDQGDGAEPRAEVSPEDDTPDRDGDSPHEVPLDRDGGSPDEVREAKAKRVLRTLHRQLKDAITAKRYDRVPALVDRLGVVAKVLGRGVAE